MFSRRLIRSALMAGACLAFPAPLAAQEPLPPFPDSTGWGVHVLAVARDPRFRRR